MPSFGIKFLACLLLSSAILVSGQFEHYLDSLQPSELYEFEEGSLGSIHYLPKGDNKTFYFRLALTPSEEREWSGTVMLVEIPNQLGEK